MLLCLSEFSPLVLSAPANINGVVKNLVSLCFGGRLVLWRKVLRKSRLLRGPLVG